MPETQIPETPEQLEPSRNGESHEAQETLVVARIGIWLFVGALSMMFGALALIWLLKYSDRLSYYFVAPKILWASTAAIITSSFTYHRSLRAIRADNQTEFVRWLGFTLLLAVAFVIFQAIAWVQLVRSGVTGQTNVFSGLFYILTGVHAAHVLGGVAWVGFVYRQARRGVYTATRHLGVDLGAVYWHFMDVVWLVFFTLVMFL